MKKKALKIIGCLFICCSGNLFSQTQTDTLFLKKTNYQRIFIDPNVNSVYYDMLKEPKISNLERSYISLYRYKDNFYLYAPCDWMYNSKIEINKQKIFFQESETVEFIIKKKIIFNKNHIKYKFKNSFGKKGSLEIKPYNDQNEISIIRIKFKNRGAVYQLMVGVDKLKSFQIIVNDCQYNKNKEFEFDKTDLSKEFYTK